MSAGLGLRGEGTERMGLPMKRSNAYRIAIVLAIGLLGTGAQGQPQFRRPEQGPQFVFYDAVNLFSSDSTRARIDVHYRIDENFFIAVKNPDTSFPHEFRRRGEVAVELADSVAGSVARKLEAIFVGAESAESSPGPNRWHQGVFSFEVRPGTYRIFLEVNDLESNRNFVDRSRTLDARNARSEPLAVSTPLFIAKPDTIPALRKVVAQNIGGDLLFGTATSLLIEISSIGHPNGPVTLRYRIASLPPSSAEPPEITIQDSVTLPLVKGFELTTEKGADGISYVLAGGRPDAPPFVVLPFPGEKLILRTYHLTLTISEGKLTKEITREFRTVWPDMPMSLKDVDYALDIMRYITTPDQLDSLKSGNYEARRKHLEEYWKSRDRTPGTAYNEVMTEYYRRVDHAMRTFGTLRNPDGARSDRGRIYILHGPPTRTERTLNPAGMFAEIWIYERTDKRFTFVDKSRNGNYELTPANPQ
jgi:GWxTD domain-containing protein